MIDSNIVKRALAVIKGRAGYEKFFEELRSPEWIEPLLIEGFFKIPPEPEQEGSTIQFPFWPESRYLVRVAAEAPRLVCRVFSEMPETTNFRVIEDLADAVVAVPAGSGARLARRLADSVAMPYSFLLQEKIAAVAVHFAQGGRHEESLLLLRRLLKLEGRERDPEIDGLRADPRPLYDPYQYEQILGIATKNIVEALGIEALEVVEDALEEFIELQVGGLSPDAEFSNVDRASIGDHSQNWNHGLIDPLVDAVRDNAVRLSANDNGLTRPIVIDMLGRPWRIFRRLAMYVLTLAKKPDLVIVRGLLVNHDNYEDFRIRREYSQLSGRFFSSLSTEDQVVLLDWIDAQDEGEIISLAKEYSGKDISEAEARDIGDRQRLARLIPIADSLPPAWKERFEQYRSKFGIDEVADFSFTHSEAFTGPSSPVGIEALASMAPADLVTYLRTWNPDGKRFDEPTREGLGRALSGAVGTHAIELSEHAELFIGLRPVYVRSFLLGIEEALKKGRTPDWEKLINLCAWVITNPPLEIDEAGNADLGDETHWGWTRSHIAGVLKTGLGNSNVSPNLELRSSIWSVLKPLTDDSNPTPEHEAQYGGSNMEPTMLSINTVRGMAMHALIEYALWVFRGRKAANDVDTTFNEMPEVRAVLDRHLDPAIDPSLAVRSVYGRWSPWLIFLDGQWFTENHRLIYPVDPTGLPFWDAAWGAYIRFSAPYDNVMEAMTEEYRHAVEFLEDVPQASLGNPGLHLLMQIIMFYGRGRMELGDGGLRDRVLELPIPNLRGKALGSVGWSIYQKPAGVGTLFADRIRALWDVLYAAAEAAGEESIAVDLREFGWWFSTGLFDPMWSFGALKTTLRYAQWVEPVHLVLERLVAWAPSYPRQSIECLRVLIDTRSDPWPLFSWTESISKILRTGMASSETEVNRESVALVHRLGQRGYSHYRSLLSG